MRRDEQRRHGSIPGNAVCNSVAASARSSPMAILVEME
jgi:hypothetical protein